MVMLDKTPLIYIVSNGRSGSTLLDLLLGSHPQIWTLGEAQMLPFELRQNRICGCGLPIAECEFWTAIIPQIPLLEGDYPIMYFRGRDGGGGKVLRWELLPGVMRRKLTTDKWRRAAAEYGRVNVRFLVAVRQAAEKRVGNRIRWLVDASKDLYRLFWLEKSGLFELRVIHLTKDPRAYVYSMVNSYLPGAGRKVIRFSGRWIVENALASHICGDEALVGKTWRLRYEDLASNPEVTLQTLGDWLGLEFSASLPENFRALENHAISGGRMRWQNTPISLDEKWRQSLPRGHARTVWALARFMAQAYGYG